MSDSAQYADVWNTRRTESRPYNRSIFGYGVRRSCEPNITIEYLVTGIGRETAIALSAYGWKLVLTARRYSSLEKTAKLCTGSVPYIVAGDVTDEQCVQVIFEAVRREFGAL